MTMAGQQIFDSRMALLAAGDVDGLAKTLELVVSDTALQARVGARARRRVLEQFTTEHQHAQLVVALEEA